MRSWGAAAVSGLCLVVSAGGCLPVLTVLLCCVVLCCVLQDASTASLVWVLTLMAERPDVLERVRAEQAAARPDLDATITAETLTQMPYTRQVGQHKRAGMRQGSLRRWQGKDPQRHVPQQLAVTRNCIRAQHAGCVHCQEAC